MQSLSSFLISSVVTCTLMQILLLVGVLMETRRVSLAWGQVNSPGKKFTWETEGRRKLCMVSCHSCYIYGEGKRWRGRRF